MTIKVVDEFRPGWDVVWATTYTFELATFEDFLLPRLGAGPFRATILADANRLAAEWDHLADSPVALRANRDYLVRGVAVPGAFHPKTIILANRRKAVLLVGSGNLTLHGLAEGEVFTRFESGTESGDDAIATWRSWMDQIVEREGDVELTRRWSQSRGLIPAGTVRDSSPLIVNDRVPIAGQIVDQDVATPCDEMHVTAPFWDEDCSALKALLDQHKPRRLSIYLCHDASVDGRALQSLLAKYRFERLQLWRFGPQRFVHAKVIGLIAKKRGLLVAGSPNLSDAALWRTDQQPGGNAEAATTTWCRPDEVREFFHPSDMDLTELNLDELATFDFAPTERLEALPYRLRHASLLSDGRVTLHIEPAASNGLRLRASSGEVELDQDLKATSGPVELAEGDRFVWLISPEGDRVSNSVPVDLPDRLEAFANRGREDRSRPTGAQAQDFENPLGWIVSWLHNKCIFDVDEAAPRGASGGSEEVGGSFADDDFWDRIQNEELQRDPRLVNYAGFVRRSSSSEDPILLMLEGMLESAPMPVILRMIRATTHDEGDGLGEGEGHTWSIDARTRVRLFNVLMRWIRALGDQRLRWINPFAPVRNFEGLSAGLLFIWLHDLLDDDRLTRLTQELLEQFVGTPRAGYLSSLEEAEREEALAHLDVGTKDAVSVLAYTAVEWVRQGEGWGGVFAWQDVLKHGLNAGILKGTPAAAAIASALWKSDLSANALQSELERAATYEDDERWCARMAAETGLSGIQLHPRSGAKGIGAHVEFRSGVNLLGDAAVPKLAVALLRYRRTDGVLLQSGDDRIALQAGNRAAARIDGVTVPLADEWDIEKLESLVEHGGSFASLSPQHSATDRGGDTLGLASGGTRPIRRP